MFGKMFLGTFFSAACAMASAAQAAVFFGSSGNLSASADISSVFDSVVNTSTVTIVLTNLTPNTANAADLLTAITIPGTDSFTTSMITGRAGLLTTIGTDKEGTVPAGTFTDWRFQDVNGSNSLTFHPDAKDAIIGPPTGFDGANPVWSTLTGGSIAGSPGHNPLIDETATFTVSVPCEFDVSTCDVTFWFGTQFGTCVDGPPASGSGIPEPASVGVLGLGASGLLRRRGGA